MSLYSIDEKLYYLIEEGFDSDTGEILEGFDLNKAINEATMELDKKLENIAVYIKNLKVEIEALTEEKKKLEARRKTKENKLQSLERYLDGYFRNTQSKYFEDTTGKEKFHKFETSKCVISYRKSDSIKITDVNKVPQEYIKPRVLKDTDVKKSDIKDYLKKHEDETIDGIELLHNKNISVK